MKIIHIKKWHNIPFDIKPGPEAIERATLAQFIIAHEIMKRPGYPVLVEEQQINISDPTIFPAKFAKMQFPEGISTDFNKLTLGQKNFLYTYGAAHTLFYLGKIPSIYKATHNENRDFIDIQISQGDIRDNEKRFSARGIDAIECAKEAALINFKNLEDSTVILVFGRMHNFKPVCNTQGIELEVIDTAITFKIPILETKELRSKRISLFLDNPITSSIVPIEIQKTLKNGGIEDDYIKTGCATLQQLIDLQKTTPWVIDAMRCQNIREGIYNNDINLEQLSKLTEDQVISIKHKYEGVNLSSAVESYLSLAGFRYK